MTDFIRIQNTWFYKSSITAIAASEPDNAIVVHPNDSTTPWIFKTDDPVGDVQIALGEAFPPNDGTRPRIG